jgi:hypothetical protein
MRICRFLSVAVLMCVTCSGAHAQNVKLDEGFLGLWNLDVAKSDFASQPKPRMGQVNWGAHGWAFALVLANGEMFSDGVQTDSGCIYIGVSPLSCQYEIIAPRHVRLTMKDGTTVIRVGEIELLDDGTTRTTHRVMPSDGPPYVEKTIWVRQK